MTGNITQVFEAYHFQNKSSICYVGIYFICLTKYLNNKLENRFNDKK